MTYDSVSWHTDGGPGAPAPDVAGRHIVAVLDWLARHDLLSDLGRELQELPLSEDTSLTDDMLTPTRPPDPRRPLRRVGPFRHLRHAPPARPSSTTPSPS